VFILFFTYVVICALANRKVKQPTTEEQNAATPIPSSLRRLLRVGISNVAEAIGFLTFVLAIIDVGIGFNLAISPNYNKKWTPLVIAVVLLCIIIYTVRWFLAKNKKDDAVEGENDISMQRLKEAQAERGYANFSAPPEYFAQSEYPAPEYGVPTSTAWETRGSGLGGNEVGKGEMRYQTVDIPRPFHS
jgi:hypothetical protein